MYVSVHPSSAHPSDPLSSDGLPQSTSGVSGPAARTVSSDFVLADVPDIRLVFRLSLVSAGTPSLDLGVLPFDFGVMLLDFDGAAPLDLAGVVLLGFDFAGVLPFDFALALPPPRLDTTSAPEFSLSGCSLSWRLPRLPVRSLPLPVLAPPDLLRLR